MKQDRPPEDNVYQVIGQKIQLQVYSITAKCPHKKVNEETGEIGDCSGITTTVCLESMEGEYPETGERVKMSQKRVTFDPQAVAVFDAGGTVAVRCGICGSILEVSRGRIARVSPNAGMNRKQRRAKGIHLVKN